MNKPFSMPRPQVGDVVLFSPDMHSFANPCIAFVIQEPGDSTVNLLTFTRTGWVERPSVHHRSDPNLSGDNGWADLGVWDFAPMTRAIYKAAAQADPKERLNNSVSSK